MRMRLHGKRLQGAERARLHDPRSSVTGRLVLTSDLRMTARATTGLQAGENVSIDRSKGRPAAEPPLVAAGFSHSIPTDHRPVHNACRCCTALAPAAAAEVLQHTGRSRQCRPGPSGRLTDILHNRQVLCSTALAARSLARMP